MRKLASFLTVPGRSACAAAVLAAAVLAFAPAASAEGIGEGEDAVWMDKSRNSVNAEVVDKLGERAPLDVRLTRHDGRSLSFGEAFLRDPSLGTEQERLPVLLVLGYYECPMLCSLVLNASFEGLAGVDLEVGRDYRVAVVSINPEETVELAKTKRANYLKRFPLQGAPEQGVDFFVSSAEETKRLAKAVGFNFYFDKKSEQWAHGAGIFFLAPGGTLVRTLTGVSYTPQNMKFAFIDAGEGKVGSLVDRIVMSCFHYVPDSHQYGLYIWGAVRMAGLLIVLSLGSLLLFWWRRERLRKGPAAL